MSQTFLFGDRGVPIASWRRSGNGLFTGGVPVGAYGARTMSMGLAENAARWRALRSANLEIRPAERRVLADGRPVGVTVREFETLLALAERRNRVVPRAELYALVWGGPMTYRDRSVDVFVRRVRKKLDAAAPGWEYIHTHFGIGYRFAPERRTEAARSAPLS